MKHIHFGDVFYVRKSGKEVGSEQKAGRPAVIVSNDINNRKAPTVNVVYLSDKDPSQRTHVWIPSRGRLRGSTATCEQVTTVSKMRIGDYITHLSVAEMEAIQRGLQVQLNIGTNAHLTCDGCISLGTSFGPCMNCIRSRLRGDMYRRPPEGEEEAQP